LEGGGTPQTRKHDTGVVFACLGCGKPPRHEERDWVVEGGGKGPRHENATLGLRFHVWGAGNIRVRVVEGGQKGPRHENATLGSCFHVWGAGNIRVWVVGGGGKGGGTPQT